MAKKSGGRRIYKKSSEEPKEEVKQETPSSKVQVENRDHVHPRFKRKVWIFVKDLTSSMAKNLVNFSPYTVPDNLVLCIEKFQNKVKTQIVFTTAEMAEIDLINLSNFLYEMIKDIPEFQALEVPKSNVPWDNSDPSKNTPDQNFIGLKVLANSITVDLAQKADAECWLDHTRE